MADSTRLTVSMSPTIEGFRIMVPVEVRWGDMDALGHVNNTVYFRYFESARIAWFERLGLLGGPAGSAPGSYGTVGPILAQTACDFRRPVSYPARLLCGIRLVRLGQSSLTHAYRLVDATDPTAPPFAEGQSVVVLYDYARATKVPIPDAVREAIAALEGAPPSGAH